MAISLGAFQRTRTRSRRARRPAAWRLAGRAFLALRVAPLAIRIIHDHYAVEDGPWHDPRSCWFNALYTRVVPGHAVEMTAALLDRTVARTLVRNRITTASLRQRQDLAALTYLCGSGTGNTYARRGFRLRRGQRCGDHDPRRYLAEVNALKRQFARLAASG
jgi:hypothetical protein